MNVSLTSPRWLAAIMTVVAMNLASAGAISATDLRPGACDRQAEKLVGQKPVRPHGSIRPPKRIHGDRPKFPTRDTPTTGTGPWMADALIDIDGKIRELWVLRQPTLTPPWPEFNTAIEESIRQWQYEPLIVKGKRVPVCMTVTMTIDWR